MYAIATPTVLYALFGIVFTLIFDSHPKHNKIIVKYLTYLLFIGIVSRSPITLIIKAIPINDGSQICDRISWMSPTTYVKNISLCN
ncbi:DUF1240 domain-containing protein (plasmid) [Providencia rettgeri]|nr:DUF1240 domain-containing protein [Providencia rettgeri]